MKYSVRGSSRASISCRVGRKPVQVIALLFSAVLLFGIEGPTEVRAQTGDDAWLLTERLPASSAHLIGMGGASVGGVASAGVMLTNPAGLGYFESSQASGALNAMAVSSTGRYHVADPTELSETSYALVPSNGNLVYRFPTDRGSLVVAGGFNQRGTYQRTLAYDAINTENTVTATFLPFDDEYGVRDDFRPEFHADLPFVAYEAGAIEFYPGLYEDGEYPFDQAILLGTDNRQFGEVIEEGQLREFNLGGAWEAAPNLMIGLSGNLMFGEYESNRYHEETREQDEPEPYSVIRDGQEFVGFERLEFIDRRQSSVSGVNLRFGASWWAAPAFRVGASVETPSYYQVENSFGIRMETFFEDGRSLFYSERSGEFERSNFEYNIVTPWRISLGGKILAQDLAGLDGQFVLSGDVEFVDWSQMELRAGRDDLFYQDANRDIRNVYGTALNTRLGGELLMGVAALRAGFSYYPDPRDEMLVQTNEITSQRNRTTLNLGFGYELTPALQLDVGWMHQRLSDTFFPYTDPEEELTSPPISDDVNRNLFVVGVSYFF